MISAKEKVKEEEEVGGSGEILTKAIRETLTKKTDPERDDGVNKLEVIEGGVREG